MKQHILTVLRCLLLTMGIVGFTEGAPWSDSVSRLHTVPMESVFSETFGSDLHQFGPDAALRSANALWGDKKWLTEKCLTLSGTRSALGTFSEINTLYIPYLVMQDGRVQFEFLLEGDGAVQIGIRTCEEEENGSVLSASTSALSLLARGRALEAEVVDSPIRPGSWQKLILSWVGNECALSIDDRPALFSDSLPEGSGGIFIRAMPPAVLKVRNLQIWTPAGAPHEPYRLPRDVPVVQEGPRTIAPPPPSVFSASPARAEYFTGSSGSLVDERGRKHMWHLEGDALVYDGVHLTPISGGDGEYWASVDEHVPSPPPDALVLSRVRRYGLASSPVVLLPVDYIDCTQESHGYVNDPVTEGRARIMEIRGRAYRVTSNRKDLSYFSYVLHTDHVLQPHVLVAEMPNDRERYAVMRLQPPEGELSNYLYGIGVGSYTGRDLPCDGEPYYQFMMLYPKTPDFRISISHVPKELHFDPGNGAAVSRIWLYRVAEPLWEHPVAIAYPRDEARRTLLISQNAPLYVFRLRSNVADWTRLSEAERKNCVADYAHYLRFVGSSGFMPYLADGNDATTLAYYDASRYFPGGAGPFIYPDLLNWATSLGLQAVPAIPPLLAHPNLKVKGDLSQDAYLIDKDGNPVTWIWPNLDPLHPDTQAILLGLLREMCEMFKDNSRVTGVGFRVYAEIGSCFNRGPAWVRRTGSETGYSRWDLEQFRSDTNLPFPLDSSGAYEWLRANAWKAWMDWRCRRIHDFWLRCRDLVQSYNREWDLVIRVNLPGIGWDRFQLWRKEGQSIRELYRAYGFDPELFVGDQGIRFLRTVYMSADRFVTDRPWGGTDQDDFYANTGIDVAQETQRLYAPLKNGVELYMVYWEEHGARLGSSLFGGRARPHWGAATVTPWGRHFFKPLVEALAQSNVHTISLLSWEGGTHGHEHSLRRFARAYLALPAVPPRDFKGTLTPSKNTWAAWFKDRLAVVNLSAQPAVVRVQAPWELAGGAKVLEAGTGATVYTANTAGSVEVSADLFLDAYDLAVLYAP